MSRAKALAKAIDASEPGDTVTIHDKTCSRQMAVGCMCQPRVLLIVGDESRRPIGFRPR